MSRTADEILAAELKKLAIQSAKSDTGAGVVRWVAHRLPTDAYKLEMQLQVSPEVALRSACEVLQDEGQLRDDVERQSSVPAVSAVIGSGFLGLNPALVTVEVTPLSDTEVNVTIFGTAKEGLIKQHAGKKAATTIAARLKERLTPG